MMTIRQVLNTFDDQGEFTCHDLEVLATAIGELRMHILASFDEAGTAPEAELHYMQAMEFLNIAKREMKLADICQMQKR